MSICAAHCSWVCCSKSTSRMTSYSSSVSRIGSLSPHPSGQKVSTCGVPQIRRHRGGLGMGMPPLFLFPVYTDYNTPDRKKQYSFQKPLQFPSIYDRNSQGMMNLLGFIMSLVYMQAVHGRLSTYERLVNSQNFFSPYLTTFSFTHRRTVRWVIFNCSAACLAEIPLQPPAALPCRNTCIAIV